MDNRITHQPRQRSIGNVHTISGNKIIEKDILTFITNPAFKIKAISTRVIVKIQNKNYVLPHKLKALAEEIALSKFILDLQIGWDEGAAKPIPAPLYHKAIIFLINYSMFLLNNDLETRNSEIKCPEINPCKDGTIDLSWRTKRARLLINIRNTPEGYRAFYYGDLYNDKLPIKGNVPAAGITEHLAIWMKQLK